MLTSAGLNIDELTAAAKTRGFRPVKTGLRVKLDLKSEFQTFDSPNVVALSPGSRHWTILATLLANLGTGGNLVTDAHLAALAIEHNAELHSNDADFARMPGLRIVNPLIE